MLVYYIKAVPYLNFSKPILADPTGRGGVMPELGIAHNCEPVTPANSIAKVKVFEIAISFKKFFERKSIKKLPAPYGSSAW